jgi:putative intracellular protease/amidase
MAVILIPLPRCDFDPTESGVPWRLLRGQGHRIVFATPDGQPGEADPKTLNGQGLGPFAALLRADANGASAYEDMRRSREFQHPIPYQDIRGAQVDALLLPGGHAPGMRPYLESAWLQLLIAEMFEQGRPVGAICHGVLLVARSRNRTGRSVLHGRTTTGLTRSMELCGWALTRFTVGEYYRTYPTTVEDEVRSVLARPDDFVRGPFAWRRDTPTRLDHGFAVRDGSYVSARWPGDAHYFTGRFAGVLSEYCAQTSSSSMASS